MKIENVYFAVRITLSVLFLIQTVAPASLYAVEPRDLASAEAIQPVVPYDPNLAISDEPRLAQARPSDQVLTAADSESSETPVIDVVSVEEDTVAESRDNIDDFMSLLASKGITQFTQEEVAGLKPENEPSQGVTGVYLVSQQDNQAAVAFSGEITRYNCTIVGTIPFCRTISKIPTATILYKPTPVSGVEINTSQLKGIQMGFSTDGNLVITDYLGQNKIYDQSAQIIAHARTIEIVTESTEETPVSMITPLYRLYASITGDHLYTASEAEVEAAKASGYVTEGIAGYLSLMEQEGAVPLYRLFNPNKRFHFYTTSLAERDTLIAAGYQNEGIAGYVVANQITGTAALYRLYNLDHGSHVFTMSESEKDALIARGYRFEGIAAYMATSPIPTVPEGWIRTASNPNFAFRIIDPQPGTPFSGLNHEAHLLDLLTNEDMIVGSGSATRHDSAYVDTDGQVVLVAYHESGPIVGSLSWVELHRLSDLSQDPQNGYKVAEMTIPGVYQSHEFTSGNVIINVEVYNTETPEPNDTKINTVTIPISEILNAVSLPQDAVRTNTNPDFYYHISQGGTTLTLYHVTPNGVTSQVLISGRNVNPLLDVSRNGGNVVYHYSEGGGVNETTVIQRVENPSKQLILTSYGSLEGLSFTAHNEVVLDTATFNAITINLNNLQPFDFKIDPNEQVVASPSGRFEYKDERPIGRLVLRDTKNNKTAELAFGLNEQPVLSVHMTNNRLYYVVGHAKKPVIKYVVLNGALFNNLENGMIPEDQKHTLTLPVTPRNRTSIEFLTGKNVAFVTDTQGVRHRIRLVQLESQTASSTVDSASLRAADPAPPERSLSFAEARGDEAISNPNSTTDTDRDEAINTAKDRLAEFLELTEEQKNDIETVSVEAKTWSNGCVGWETPESICTMAIVNDYQVVLQYAGEDYEFHASVLVPSKQPHIVDAEDDIMQEVDPVTGRITKVTHLTTGEIFLYSYNDSNKITTITSSSNTILKYSYGVDNQPNTSDDLLMSVQFEGDGNTFLQELNAQGRVIKITNLTMGEIILFLYNDLEKTYTITTGNTIQKSSYGADNQPGTEDDILFNVQFQNDEGQTVIQEIDPLTGRIIKITNWATTEVTIYAYDDANKTYTITTGDKTKKYSYGEDNQPLTGDDVLIVQSFKISAALFISGEMTLIVDVKADGSATVTRYGVSKTGAFNAQTKEIQIKFTDHVGLHRWIVSLKANPQGSEFPYFIESFLVKTINAEESSQDTTTTRFRKDGLPSSSIYQSESPSRSFASRTYYGYDSENKHDRTLQVDKTSIKSTGKTTYGAFYSIKDKANQLTRYARFTVSMDSSLYDQKNLSTDVIDSLSRYFDSEMISYYSSPELHWTQRLYSIDYIKDSSGKFTVPKLVQKRTDVVDNVVYIVHGEADVLTQNSSDPQDELFINHQHVNGYRVDYGIGGSESKFGMIFSKQVTGSSPTASQTATSTNSSASVVIGIMYESVAFVDYPAENTVRLNDVLYQIQIDSTGKLSLTQILVPQGWTLTPTNPNFAYRVIDDAAGANKILQLLNIAEEFSYDVATVNNIHKFTSVDVSEDGTTLDYTYTTPGFGSAGDSQPVLQKSAFSPSTSNLNFSFATRVVGSLSLQLYFYNAATKHATLLDSSSLESFGPDVFDIRDVSADGKYVVFSKPSSKVEVQSLEDPSKKLVVDLIFDTTYGLKYKLANIEWGDEIAILNILHPLTNKPSIIVVNLETLTYGNWTRAASNANFAFKILKTPAGEYALGGVILQLIDLMTGEIQNLTTVTTGGEISPKRDVAPDGKTVVYETGGMYTPYGGRIYTTHIQQIEDPTKKLSIDNTFYTQTPVLYSIDFGNRGPVVRLRNEFEGTVILDRYGINQREWKVSTSLHNLIKKGSSVFVDPDTKLVTMIWSIYNPKFEVWIYDASDTTGRMRVLKKLVLRDSPGLEGTMTFIDTFTTPGGREVVSFSFVGEVSDYPWSATVVIDPRTGEEIAINGVIQSVEYTNGIAAYTVKRPNGSIWIDYVNLETMQPMMGEKQTVSLTSPLYRLYHSRTGDHLYTMNPAEVESAKQAGYVEENIAGYLASTQEPGTAALYRLFNPNAGLHFYTMSLAERDALIARGYRNEGIAGYLFANPVEGTSPLYRLYNTSAGTHIFTMSEGEKNFLISQRGYVDEGIVGYMATSATEITIPEPPTIPAETPQSPAPPAMQLMYQDFWPSMR